MTGTTISNNVGNPAAGNNHSGAGIALAFSAVGSPTFTTTMTNVTISGNTATASGGGMLVSGAVGTATFNNTRITGNSVSSAARNVFGGGISTSGINTLTFNNSVISGNTATSTTPASFTSFGGGVNYQDGTLNFNDTAVSGNSAANGGGLRAGAFSTGAGATVTFNRSAVTGNNAVNNGTTAGDGGGIIFFSNGTVSGVLNLNNSTVGNNTSTGGASGIEIFNFAAGNITANLNYSTVAGNSATGTTGVGGGVANFGQQTSGATGVGTFNLTSSVVANNTASASADILGVITSGGYNHVEDTTGGTFTAGTGDVTGTDPALGSLGLNGGQTPNYLPDAGSPLIDAIPTGTNQCGTAPFNVDQKNVNRPFAAGCDKGASERGLVIVTPSNGLPSGRQNVPYSATLTADFGTPPYTFSLVSGTLPPGLTVNADGTINGTPTTAGSYFFSVQVSDATPFRFAPSAVQVKQFQIVILAPTAASVTVGGRVLVNRRGVANVVVTMTDQNGSTRSARTNNLGYYRFDDVSAGTDYVFQATAKRYSFDPQIVTVTEGRDDLNFAATAAQK
jgi:hypothetical protein